MTGKRKVWPALLLLVALSFGMVGCEEPSTQVGGSSPLPPAQDGEKEPEAMPEPAAPVPSTPEKPEDLEKVGVITDTVVDVFREHNIRSERVTQAIFNQPVTILDTYESWIKVQVVDGYEGWIKSKFIVRDPLSVQVGHYEHKVVVTSKKAKVYSEPNRRITLKEIVMGTEFYVTNKVEGCYQAVLPGGTVGWVHENGTIKLPAKGKIPSTSVEDFLATVHMFEGTPYLWGGVSGWQGLDCSGLTYICSRVNGVDLPRDAEPQFKSGVGEVVPKNISSMKPGDLVFFSSGVDLKGISHVGIYIGDEKFIHASQSSRKVTIGSVTSDYFKKRLVGVKRLFG